MTDQFTGYKDYKVLRKTNEYDHVKAEALAEAVTERIELQKRVDVLNRLIEENTDLSAFLWTTREGICKPLHEIKDDHLKNIITHLMERGAPLSASIRAEAESRDIELPSESEQQSRRIEAYARAMDALDGEVD